VSDFPVEHPVCSEGSDKALEFAVMTVPAKRDKKLVKKLEAVAGRVLKR
jgi:5'-methylthioadenosine phosphorylase